MDGRLWVSHIAQPRYIEYFYTDVHHEDIDMHGQRALLHISEIKASKDHSAKYENVALHDFRGKFFVL